MISTESSMSSRRQWGRRIWIHGDPATNRYCTDSLILKKMKTNPAFAICVPLVAIFYAFSRHILPCVNTDVAICNNLLNKTTAAMVGLAPLTC